MDNPWRTALVLLLSVGCHAAVRDDPLDLAYCNQKMDTGLIPALPSAHELLQVQVMVRHGARVPDAQSSQCWPGDTATFDCQAPPTGSASFDGGIPSSVLFKEAGWENQRLFGYAPQYVLSGGSCLQGQLVQSGYQMHFRNGENLRRAYVRSDANPNGLLPEALEGNQDQLYVRADSTPPGQRTRESAEALISAMFPGSATAAALQVCNNNPNSISLPLAPAPALNLCQDKAAALLEEPQAVPYVSAAHTNSVTVPLMQQIAALTNRSLPSAQERQFPLTNAVFLLETVECGWARSCPTVPCSNRTVPAAIQALMPQLIGEATLQLYAIFNNSEVKKYISGPILRDVMVGVDAAVGAWSGARKFILYSGHDLGPMMNVWAALGVGEFKWAPFASLMAVELYKSADGSHVVRIVSNGQVQQLPESDTEGLIDWGTFRSKYLATHVPDPEECPSMYTAAVLHNIHNCSV